MVSFIFIVYHFLSFVIFISIYIITYRILQMLFVCLSFFYLIPFVIIILIIIIYIIFHNEKSSSPISIILYHQLIFLHNNYLSLLLYHSDFFLIRISFSLLYLLYFHIYHHISDSSTVFHLFSTVGFCLSSLTFFW